MKPLAIAFSLAVTVGLWGLAACTKRQGREAVTIAADACVLLHGLDATAETICATEAELAPIVQHLLAARKLRGANPTGHPVDACLVPLAP